MKTGPLATLVPIKPQFFPRPLKFKSLSKEQFSAIICVAFVYFFLNTKRGYFELIPVDISTL